MRIVMQRVSESRVDIDGTPVGAIGKGWLILLGIRSDDTDSDLAYMVDKTLNLRGFPDSEGKMNLSVLNIKGEILVVSQFTLYGDTNKGRRPGFVDAAKPDMANSIYERYLAELRESGLKVATGIFQADMKVSLTNDGPVTFILDSRS